MLLLRVFLTAFLIHTTQQLNNGLGLTPQMGTYDLSVFFFRRIISSVLCAKGWNSWNHFGCNINENLIKQTADIIASSGLRDAGYEYGLFTYF